MSDKTETQEQETRETDVTNNDTSTVETSENKKYENAAELTGLPGGGKDGPGWFSRRNVMLVICFALVFIVMFGFVFNINKSKKKKDDDATGRAARTPKEFLNSELENSLSAKPETGEVSELTFEPESTGLPEVTPVSYTEMRTTELRRGDVPARAEAPPPSPSAYGNNGSGSSGGSSGGGGYRAPPFTANRSSLVPPVEGSLFPGNGAARQASSGTYAEKYPYMEPGANYPAMPAYPASGAMGGAMSGMGLQGQDPYAAQNNQADKKAFYDSGYASGGITGAYIGDDSLWVGTIIPAVLETAVNTDLPGNILARVSQNVYDSRSGVKLLIPQGSILVAKYNSSVSYAQHRVQIVWDLLIRPDGYQVELQGMNGVDSEGMSGLPAEYHENWFEYLKAAGIITMFTVANSKMAEEAAKYRQQGCCLL
jgi:type IV secretion system protein VirB10